ncbi:hypothetical protein JTB14_036661 [Gonioctena quinquepunctata]|nr:hypothetical protein JTB14_036661 [Gonioctena quinquepunctata]
MAGNGYIYKINPNRAPGPDGVPGTVLALAFSGLEDQLTRLYGLCYNLAYFPDAWKHGNLITILKAPDKDPSDPKSLRPITLLSELGKVLERIIKYAVLSQERRICSTLVSSDLDLVNLRYMQLIICLAMLEKQKTIVWLSPWLSHLWSVR